MTSHCWQILWSRSAVEGLPASVTASLNVDLKTGLRVLFVDIPGPLCSCSIVVPTEARGEKGLPHCLEHLVFLGSASHPHRGFLDLLASRCMTPGTNAETAEDRTTFTVCCAGPEGLLHILPALLDHVANPTLDPESMLTEIYHLGEGGEEAGVVFCEMQGRENSEGDRCEIALRSLALAGSGYTANTGGKSDAIAELEHDEVVGFHRRFYSPEKMAVIVMDPTDREQVFNALESVPFKQCPASPAAWEDPIPPLVEDKSSVVRFPSEDEDVGSVVIAWRGPPYSDVETAVALEVLCRFFSESAASVLHQRFVDRNRPLASEVDIGLLNFKETLIELSFFGVPKFRQRKKRRGAGQKSPSPPPGSGVKEQLLSAGALKRRVAKLFRQLRDRGHIGEMPGEMPRVVRRHRIKMIEDMEDEPQNTLEEILAPDLVFCKDGKGLGARLGTCDMLRSLETKPEEFWIALLDKWVVTAPSAEVVMVPDAAMAEEIDMHRKQRRGAIVAALGPDGMARRAKEAAEAKKKQMQPLDPDVIRALPPVPHASSIPMHPVSASFSPTTPALPFPAQVLRVQTQFAQVRMCFDLAGLAHVLRPYLVLFQELLLSSPVCVPDGSLTPYTTVVRKQNEDLVSIECGVGFGSSSFGCECMSDVFTLWAVAETTKYGLLCQWLSDLIRRTVFTAERVETVAENLVAAVAECSRDGAGICEAVSTFVTSVKGSLSNDVHIGVLVQQRLLEHACKSPELAAKALSAIREHLLACTASPNSVLAQFVCPADFPDPVESFAVVWKSPANSVAMAAPLHRDSFFAFPYQRQPTTCEGGKCIVVPIGGVETTFLQQWVSCDVPKLHDDFFPLLILAELLSRTEGPLYTRIRGAGLAYDASVGFHLFSGMIGFDLHESPVPEKALAEFHGILRELATPAGFDSICSSLLIEAARSSLLYYFHSDRATVTLLVSAALKGIFKGFLRPDLEITRQARLDQVDQAAVRRVFERYYLQFLDNSKRVTVVTTGSSNAAKLIPALESVGLTPVVVKLNSLAASIDIRFFSEQTVPGRTPKKKKKKKKTAKQKRKAQK